MCVRCAPIDRLGLDFHRGWGRGHSYLTGVGFFVYQTNLITEKVFDQIGFSLQIHVAMMYPILT